VTAIAARSSRTLRRGFVVLDSHGEGEFGDAVPGDRVMLRV
jgi:hypothetical protein